MPMHPRPRPETVGPLRPSVRVCMEISWRIECGYSAPRCTARRIHRKREGRAARETQARLPPAAPATAAADRAARSSGLHGAHHVRVTPAAVPEIGRASGRERGEISVVAVSLKKKKESKE